MIRNPIFSFTAALCALAGCSVLAPSPTPTRTAAPTRTAVPTRTTTLTRTALPSATRRPVTSLTFAGRNWRVKSSLVPVGPGPNLFSNNAEDVFVDAQGRLHLRIVNRGGQWYSTEVISTGAYGYGTYTFQLAGAVDFDPNSPFMQGSGSYVQNLQHLLAVHAAHPAYLRHNGRPVIFFYNVSRLSAGAWQSLRDQADPQRQCDVIGARVGQRERERDGCARQSARRLRRARLPAL